MSGGKVKLADVAKLAGVSPTAASFALRGKQGSGIPRSTADKVWEAAAKLGYAKPSMAKLREWIRAAYITNRVEYFNPQNSFFANVYGHLQRNAVKNRFQFLLMEFDPLSAESERERTIHEMKTLGVEVVLTNVKTNVKPLQARGFKVVLVQGGATPDCICVHCDDHEAGRLAAVHALANGHKELGTIFPSGMDSHPRMSGFLKGVKDAGADCQEKFRWTLPLDQAKAVEKLTRLAASSKKLPTLFYCYSDALLFPALRGFAKTGLKVPSQVSLIGTENLYWGAHGLPAFTTVDLLEKVFAKHLADAIRDAASGESPYCVASPVRLVERETVESLL